MIIRLFLALVTVLVLPCPSFSQNKGDQLFQQGKELVESEEFDKAVKSFLSARSEFLREKNYQRYFSAVQAVAIIYQDTGNGEEAEKILNEAFITVPNQSVEQLEIHSKIQDNLGYTYLYVLDQSDKALKAYSASIDLLLKAGKENSNSHAFELVNYAVVANLLYQYPEAIKSLQKAISIYEKNKDTEPSTLISAYQSLGNNYRQSGLYEQAINAFQKAITLAADFEDVQQLAALYNDLGISYQGKGAFADARDNLELALSLTEKAFGKEADHYAQNLINLSNLFESMGDLDQSLALFQQIAAIYTKTPPTNDQDLIDVLLNLSRISNDLGMLEQSTQLVNQALQLSEQKFGKNSLLEADILMSRAAISFGNSEFDVSLNENFKALAILDAQKFGGLETYAMIYNNIGQAYDELFEIDLALKYKQQALTLYQQLGGSENASVAMALENIGLTYEMANDYDQALTFLKQALVMKIKFLGNTHDDVGTTHLNIGLVYLKKLDVKNSLESLEKARNINDRYQKHKTKAMIYNRIGAAHALGGSVENALQNFQRALVANCIDYHSQNISSFPEKANYLNYYELTISLLSKADMLAKSTNLTDLKTARAHLDEADKVLLNKSSTISNSKDRLEVAEANYFFTEVGMNLAHTLFQRTQESAALDLAFYCSERNKANELLSDLKATRYDAIGRVPRKMIDRQKELSARLRTLDQQIATAYQAKNTSLITQLKSKQLELTTNYANLQKELEANAPALATYQNRSLVNWSTVQSTLDMKVAIVSYTITDSAKYVMVGTKTSLTLLPLDRNVDLEKWIRGYRNFITFKNDAYGQLSKKIYDEIWRPVQRVLDATPGIENIIIIADGPLSYLPFETLGEGKFLLEKYDIRYELSASIFAQRSPRPVNKKPSFIALAPVFNDKETSFVNKSCERMASATIQADTTSRAFSNNGDYIAPLPATEKEVEQIHQIHLENDLFSRYFTKENASEELIKKGELARYDYIHLATHGIANSQYPELSGLLLSQQSNGTEDGVLYTGEIVGLDLKADLVTLSACETALGKRIEGEGVRGLTSAFLIAGARTVVVSLWKVADESTSLFMIEFYNQLLSGKPKSTALREAKLRLLQNPLYQHPYFWAPFIQVGNN
jgi:CHAT domain-containing protein